MDAQRKEHYRVELLLALALQILGSMLLGTPGFAQVPARPDSQRTDSQRTEPVASLVDAKLHDCRMLSIDRAFAVGDAGAILMTDDGGKQWKNLSAGRSEFNYYAIGMEDRNGLIVGGTIEPATGRSIGIVLITQDEGKTWNPSGIPGLPRLIGLQRIKHRHWIAWGDWSDHFGSALFESIDGGRSWSPRPIPCGHLQSVAMSDEGSALIVDRASRVFFAADGVDFRSVAIDTDQFRPIRFCKLQPQGWWLGGDSAQLWHSIDGLRWQSIDLPIAKEDAPLVDLVQMKGGTDRMWIVGKPGNLIWCSEDHGASWIQQPTGVATVLLGLDSWNDQVLMACGRLGTILQSRNSGRSWRQTHASAQRTLGLSISATDQSIPWDALAYIAHEGQHQAAALVVHNRRFTEDLHHQLDRVSALECLASRIHLDHVTTHRGLPISDLPNGTKINDLAYYQRSSDALLRWMVQEIRLHRPDVVLVDDLSSSDMLRSANGALATQAVQLAGNPSFSPAKSLIEDQLGAWTVQRTIQRSESSGFTLAPSMVLKKSNQLLAKPLQPIRYYYASGCLPLDAQAPESLEGQVHYRLVNHKSATISHPLDGLVVQNDTKICDKPLLKIKLATLMASANATSRVSQLLQTRGSELYRENAWDESLLELIKPLSPESALDVLWMVSQESRVQGNWHRWHASLQLILARFSNQEQQEMAYRELMTYTGSAEIEQLIRGQLQQQTDQSVQIATAPTSNAASPFGAQDSGVKPASYINESRLTPIARGTSERGFAKLLGGWPEGWQTKKSEPAWAWLIASRFRTSSWTRVGGLDPTSERGFWPAYYPQLGNWSGIYEQEQIINAPPVGSLPIPRIPWTHDRPHLDGLAEPELWDQAIRLRLSTAWADETDTSTVRLCRDQDFLFVHLSSPRNRSSELASNSLPSQRSNPAFKGAHTKDSKAREMKAKDGTAKRDSMDPMLDHVRLRIDIDRDYATWFEFAWDIQGGVLDQCNDIRIWNPQWYIAFHPTDEAWNVELAIPIKELMDDSTIPWDKLPWALSIQRQRPSLSTEFLVAGDNDQWSRDQWLLVNPTAP